MTGSCGKRGAALLALAAFFSFASFNRSSAIFSAYVVKDIASVDEEEDGQLRRLESKQAIATASNHTTGSHVASDDDKAEQQGQHEAAMEKLMKQVQNDLKTLQAQLEAVQKENVQLRSQLQQLSSNQKQTEENQTQLSEEQKRRIEEHMAEVLEEYKQKEEEELQKPKEEEIKRKQEAKRKDEEETKHKEEEPQKQKEEENKRKQETKHKDEEETKRKEEEANKQKEEEELQKQKEEENKRKQEAEAKRLENERKKLENHQQLLQQQPVVTTTLITESPLHCNSNHTQCCASWDVNADKWWLHHPDWEVTVENETSYCFAPVSNQEKARYFSDVHKVQWGISDDNATVGRVDCSKATQIWQIGSGWGAASNWVLKPFLHAYRNHTPFQLSKAHLPWLYGPQHNTSWAYCEEQDLSCYILPISPCPRMKMHPKTSPVAPTGGLPRGARDAQEYEWHKEYLMRPTTLHRRKAYELRAKLNIQQPCTTMHVRRGDAAMPKQLRRYASVQEYLDVGHVEEGAHIMLLTDDNSVIEEIHKYHPNYQWTYVERQRQQGGDGGWQGHVPSGDGPWEFIVMETELRLASECEKLVYGRSGFMMVLRGTMDAHGKNYTAHVVETGVSLEEAEEWPKVGKDLLPFFIKQMDEYRRVSKAKREKKTATS